MGGWEQQDWALLISVLAFLAATASAGFTAWQGKSARDEVTESRKQTKLAEQALEHEREKRRALQTEQERDQASRVSVWCRDDYRWELPLPSGDYGGVLYVGGQEKPWQYHLRNASDATVHDVVVLFQQGGAHSLGTDTVDTLPPGEIDRDIPDRVREEARRAQKEHGRTVRALLTFRDAAGRRWRRELDGQLTRLD